MAFNAFYPPTYNGFNHPCNNSVHFHHVTNGNQSAIIATQGQATSVVQFSSNPNPTFYAPVQPTYYQSYSTPNYSNPSQPPPGFNYR